MAAGRLSRNFAIFAFLALTAEDGRAQQYSLVGNWEANVTLNGFPITSEASLRQDGSFTMNAQSNPGLEFNVDGTYTVHQSGLGTQGGMPARPGLRDSLHDAPGAPSPGRALSVSFSGHGGPRVSGSRHRAGAVSAHAMISAAGKPAALSSFDRSELSE
jgi:hypothetical protein